MRKQDLMQILLSVAIAAAVSGCGGRRCDFQSAWQHGKNYTYRMEIVDTIETRIPGGRPLIEKYRQSVHLSVVADMSRKEGSTLTLTLLGARVGKPEQKSAHGAKWGTDLTGIGGASVVYYLDKNGVTTNIAGMGAFMKRIAEHSTLANSTIAESLNDQFIRRMQFTGDDALPEKSARPGGNWINSRMCYMPRAGAIVPDIKHVFRTWMTTNGMKQAFIKWAGLGEMPTNAVSSTQPGSFNLRKWEVAGETLYCADARTVTKWRSGMRASGTVILSGRQSMVQIVTRRMGVSLASVTDSAPRSGIIENKTVKVEKKRVKQ